MAAAENSGCDDQVDRPPGDPARSASSGLSTPNQPTPGSPCSESQTQCPGELVHCVPVALLSVDASGRIVFTNRRAEQVFQFPAAELIGGPLERLIPQAQDCFGAELSRLGADRAAMMVPGAPVELFAVRRDGTEFPAAATASPISIGGQNLLAVSLYDITAQKRAEAALRKTQAQFLQAQKLEAIGRLAGGVAHDFNNLLTAILGYAELATANLEPTASGYQELEEIQTTAYRAVGLIRQLLAFSRRQLPEPRIVDLNRCVRDLERLLRRVIGEDLELLMQLNPDVARISADPGHLSQIVLNLVANARDAMPAGGRVVIETGNACYDATEIQARGLRVPPGRYVYLTVRDTGPGMDESVKARIFEPFFTTKSTDRGTGLGLVTVLEIARIGGGDVQVDSRPAGTAVTVCWPSLGPGAVDDTTTPTRHRPASGSETILLVEDDPTVRTVVSQLLVANGYSVLEATDGFEALSIAARFEAPIDLLIADVVMPQMSGPALAGKLLRRRPSLKVLYISGHAEERARQHGRSPDAADFLPKPFTAARLTEKVRNVIGTRQTRSA